MRVVRADFLSTLEAVSPGLAKDSLLEQADCFVFKNGKVHTFNDEAACVSPSGLDKSFVGAVVAKPLLELLRRIPDDELEVSIKENGFHVRGKGGRRGEIRCESEILLGVDSVEVPKEWTPLPEDFAEAVDLVQSCAIRDGEITQVCLHITPKYIEACQPPGTMVRTSYGEVPIENIRSGQRVLCYSYQVGKTNRRIVGASRDCRNRFREGHLVSRVGQRLYKGDLVVLSAEGKTTRYTTDHECLVRLDTAFQNKYIVYLMNRGRQFRVGVTGPRAWKSKWMDPRREGRSDVRTRMRDQRADSCWIIACFDTEHEALMEERLITVRYGIPDMLFRVRPGVCKNWEKYQLQCDQFWSRFGNNLEGAKLCLKSYGRRPDCPFAERDQNAKQLRYPGSQPSHRGDVEIKIRACNLMDGMKVLDADKCINGKVSSECWVPFTLSREYYNGMVHSITVDRAHTYIGDGIVTHNCDDVQLCRYKIKTGVKEKVLIRKESIRHIVQLGMSEFSEGKDWFHFRNPDKMQLSCRRYLEEYPDWSEFLNVEGEKVTMPKGLDESLDRASILLDETEEDAKRVRVVLLPGKLRVIGEGVNGRWTEFKKTQYTGRQLSFLASPKMLTEIAKRYNECEATEDRLKVDGGKWRFVACLDKVSANGEANGHAEEES